MTSWEIYSMCCISMHFDEPPFVACKPCEADSAAEGAAFQPCGKATSLRLRDQEGNQPWRQTKVVGVSSQIGNTSRTVNFDLDGHVTKYLEAFSCLLRPWAPVSFSFFCRTPHMRPFQVLESQKKLSGCRLANGNVGMIHVSACFKRQSSHLPLWCLQQFKHHIFRQHPPTESGQTHFM